MRIQLGVLHVIFMIVMCQLQIGSVLGTGLLLKERFLSVEDGLSDRNIYHLLEGSNGYIWIATSNGLNRFDGQNFKVYNVPEYPFPSNSILKLAEDWQGGLWMGFAKSTFGFTFKKQNHNGFGVFNSTLETYQSIEAHFPNLPVSSDSIISIEQFYPRVVHFTTSNGRIYRYDSLGFHLEYQHTSDFEKYLNPVPLAEGRYMGYDQDKLLDLSKDGERSSWHGKKIKVNYWKCLRALRITYDSLASHQLLYELLGKYDFANYYPNHQIILFQNQIGHTNKFEHIFFDIVHARILDSLLKTPDERIDGCYTTTHNGLVWNVIRPGVLYLSELNSYLFEKFAQGFPTRGVLEANDGSIFVSEAYKLTQYCPKANLVAQRPLHKSFIGFESWAIHSDNENLWVSTTNHLECQLLKIVPNTLEEEEILTCNASSSYIYWSIHRDQTGRLWVGHDGGISFLDEETNCLKRYKPTSEFEILLKSTIYHFHENVDGLWLASSQGVFLMDWHRNIVQHWHRKQKSLRKYLPFDHILHIYEDRAGTFWLASRGGGLIEWDTKTNEFKEYTTLQGFPNNTIYEIYEDAFGFLWMGTDNGLIRFNKRSHHIEVFTVNDGLLHNEFNTISHYQSEDGKIYLGGLKGMVRFHPKDFIRNIEYIPKLHITYLEKQDAKGEFHNIISAALHGNELTLEPTDIGVQIQFSLMEFLEPKRIIYAYKLLGTDQDWVFLDKPTFRINKLAYGKHKLLLRAKTVEGKWIPPVTLSIQVLKPFYLEVYFILMISLLVIGFVLCIIYFRNRTLAETQASLRRTRKDKAIIEKQAAQLQRIDEMKSKFFSNISHELRTPLTLIISPAQHVLDDINQVSRSEIEQQLKLIIRNGKNLQYMVNDILDLSKLNDEQMKLEEVPLNLYDFFQILFQNFNILAQQLDIHFSILNDVPPGLFVQVDKVKVEQIINNLLSNALKFTPKKGKVTLIVRLERELLCAKVMDTGVGIERDELLHVFDRFYQGSGTMANFQESSGLGLALAKELTLFIQGDLRAESVLGHGSTFELLVPVKLMDQELGRLNAVSPQSRSLLFADSSQERFEDIDSENLDYYQLTPPKNTILLVEDNEDLQVFLTKLLSPKYYMIKANNGIEALHVLQKKAVQLILTDVMMPKMDGFSLIEKLRAEEQWKGIPVIVLTALGNDEHRLKALHFGVDDYLTKPFTPQELYARVENLIARYWEKQEWGITKLSQKEKVECKVLRSVITSEEQVWIEDVKQIILRELSNRYFLLEDTAASVNLSMRQFRRKVKKITGMSPSELHREVALQEARRLLERNEYSTVKAVAQSVGYYQNIGRFSKYYFDRFGKKPTAYFL